MQVIYALWFFHTFIEKLKEFSEKFSTFSSEELAYVIAMVDSKQSDLDNEKISKLWVLLNWSYGMLIIKIVQ